MSIDFYHNNQLKEIVQNKYIYAHYENHRNDHLPV